MTRAKPQRPAKPRGEIEIDDPPRTPPPPPPRRAPARAATSGGGRAHSVIEDQLVEVTELQDVPVVKLALHEAAPHLAPAQRAIAAAGHLVVAAGTGQDGLDKITQALSDVDAVVVGIPGGEPVIDAALALAPRRPVIIAACSGDALAAIGVAAAAGADLVTVRPHGTDALAPVLLAAARLVDERRLVTNARGSEAVLRSRVEALTDGELGGLQPFELFQRALELELKRAKRYRYALSVALFALDPPKPKPPAGVPGILRARAGNALIHSIRDIDMATEIDQERFLVLLPYTDHAGAAELARRVIRAVADEKPVVAAGRSFTPHVTGAVAGAKPGQPVSFSRLMKDATQALAIARQNGVELAVSS
jgi:PleD family two-component response regulator